MSKLITSWSPFEEIDITSADQVVNYISGSSVPNLHLLGGISLIHLKSDSENRLIEDHQLDFWSEDKKWFILQRNRLHLLQGDTYTSSCTEAVEIGTNDADELKLPKKFLLNLCEVEKAVSEFLESGGIKLNNRWKPIHPFY